MKATNQGPAIARTIANTARACDLPRCTIDAAIRRGDLPAMKSGRRMIILNDDLVSWLLRCKAESRIPAPSSDEARAKFAALNDARRRKSAA